MTKLLHAERAILSLLIGLYTVVLLKPSLPFVADFVAHTLYEAEHMATIHFENGSYHVHQEVKEQSKKENSSSEEKNDGTNRFTIDDHEVVSTDFQMNSQLIFATTNRKVHLKNDSFFYGIALSTAYPPPQHS